MRRYVAPTVRLLYFPFSSYCMKGGQLGSSFYPDNNVNVMHHIDRVTLCDLK